MRVFFDSNIYISAIVYGGLPEYALSLAVEHYHVIGALYVEEEIRRILMSKKFGWKMEVVEEVIKAYCQHIEYFEATTVNALSRDPKDNEVLACAIAGKADYLVTGDKDLLVLKCSNHVRIMTPKAFVDLR